MPIAPTTLPTRKPTLQLFLTAHSILFLTLKKSLKYSINYLVLNSYSLSFCSPLEILQNIILLTDIVAYIYMSIPSGKMLFILTINAPTLEHNLELLRNTIKLVAASLIFDSKVLYYRVRKNSWFGLIV